MKHIPLSNILLAMVIGVGWAFISSKFGLAEIPVIIYTVLAYIALMVTDIWDATHEE